MTEPGAFASPRRRVDAVDIARGWAILLVVVGHAIQWTDRAFDANLVFRLIYSFHMPLFFFISGVVGAKAASRPLADQVRGRARSLMPPFLSWWLIVAIWELITRGQSLGAAAVSLYRAPDTGLWFLWVLFVVSIVAAVTLRLFPRRWSWAGLLTVALALWSIRLPVLGMGLMASYFPYFAAGLVLSSRLLEDASTGRRPLAWGAGATVLWLALALGWKRPDLTLPAQAWAQAGFPLARVVDVAYRYATATAGISATVLLAAAIRGTSRVGRTMSFLGRNTLEVYVSHQIFLGPFAGVGLVAAPLAGSVALAGSLALANVLKRIPALGPLLYGGRPLDTVQS